VMLIKGHRLIIGEGEDIYDDGFDDDIYEITEEELRINQLLEKMDRKRKNKERKEPK